MVTGGTRTDLAQFTQRQVLPLSQKEIFYQRALYRNAGLLLRQERNGKSQVRRKLDLQTLSQLTTLCWYGVSIEIIMRYRVWILFGHLLYVKWFFLCLFSPERARNSLQHIYVKFRYLNNDIYRYRVQLWSSTL